MPLEKDFLSPIVLLSRAGTTGDPFVKKTETNKKIDINGMIQLEEIPAKFTRNYIITNSNGDPIDPVPVILAIGGSILTETKDDIKNVAFGQYRVDYENGLVFFNPQYYAGQVIDYIQYTGRGAYFISANRIYLGFADDLTSMQTLETEIEDAYNLISTAGAYISPENRGALAAATNLSTILATANLKEWNYWIATSEIILTIDDISNSVVDFDNAIYVNGQTVTLIKNSWLVRTVGNKFQVMQFGGSFLGNASDVTYNNTISGLLATDVQAAIDETLVAAEAAQTDIDNHKSNDGSDHSFINQDLKTTAKPYFESLRFNLDPLNLADVAGELYYDEQHFGLAFKTPLSNVINIGSELGDVGINKTGVTIFSGKCVSMSIPQGHTPTFILASAGNQETVTMVGVTTTTSLNNDHAMVTTFGAVHHLDTLTPGWSLGQKLYLSDDGSGNLTPTAPASPNYIIWMATVLEVHQTQGSIFVKPTIDYGNGIRFHSLDILTDFKVLGHSYIEDISISGNFNYLGQPIEEQFTSRQILNGTFQETFNAVIDKATNELVVEASGGGDLTMQFSTGNFILACTPPARLALTLGTNTSIAKNYVYVPESTKVLTLGLSWPGEEHIKVSFVGLLGLAITSADGSMINQNWNDHLAGINGQGHLSHMTSWIRRQGARYYSGLEPAGSDGYVDLVGGQEGYIKFNNGTISQLHFQGFNAIDTSALDNFHIPNDFSSPYRTESDIGTLTLDSLGGSLSNRYFNIVLWGAANKSATHSPIFINLPDGSYSTIDDAKRDINGHDIYTMPDEFTIDSGTGFLIARITVRRQANGNLTIHDTQDLRRSTPDSITSAGGINTTTVSFSSSQFNVYDYLDNSKKTMFNLINLTTASTWSIYMADHDVDLEDITTNNTHRVNINNPHAVDYIQTGAVGILGTQTITGQKTFDNQNTYLKDIHVENIFQEGTTYETHAEQLFTTKNEIILREGAVGALNTNQYAGFRAKLYDGVNDGLFVFDKDGIARVGDEGSLVALLARDEQVNLTNGDILTWDSAGLIAKGKTLAELNISAIGHTHLIASITDFTDNSTNWNTAYGWGDHSLAGYLVATGASYNNTNWDTAYGWGNHAGAGYITGYTNNYVDGISFAEGKTILSRSGLSDISAFTQHNGSSTNFNTALSQGQYTISGLAVTGAPIATQIYGTLTNVVSTGDVHNNTDNWIWQRYQDTNGNEWTRYKINASVWTSWNKRFQGSKLFSEGYEVWHLNDFSSTDVGNWNTAYGWGDHSSEGYLVATGASYNNTNWDTAYGWGDHSSEGYLVATGVSYNNTNWDTAYGWGDHSSGGYLVATALSYNNSNWDTAYGWGDHADGGYQASGNYWVNSGTWLGIHTDKTRIFGISNGGGEFWIGHVGTQLHAITDGFFYQNEGQYRVIDENDSRLSDDRDPTAHAHTFASLTSKPTTISGFGITDALVLGTTITTAYRGDRGLTAYTHSQVAHAPSDAVAAGATGDAHAIVAHAPSDAVAAGATGDAHAIVAHAPSDAVPEGEAGDTHAGTAHAPSNADKTSDNETSHSDVVVDGDVTEAATASKIVKRDSSGNIKTATKVIGNAFSMEYDSVSKSLKFIFA